MLTPKETGNRAVTIYPTDIEYSALLSAGFTSTGTLSVDALLTFSLKLTASSTGYLMHDLTNHYMCRVVKNGQTLSMYINNTYLGSGSFSVAETGTAAAVLTTALLFWTGNDRGYVSNLYVVDGTVPDRSVFWDSSGKIADLVIWKKLDPTSLSYGTYGGHYDFHDAANLGLDVSGGGNHWNISGVQTDDTPTHNGGVAAWEGLPEPEIMETSEYADIFLRVGDGTSGREITTKFRPGFLTVKSRNNARDWMNTNNNLGTDQLIYYNKPDGFDTLPDSLSLSATGYIVGNNSTAAVNVSGESYLDLAIKSDPGAGFCVVGWQGNGESGRQIQLPAGFPGVPTFIMAKCISADGVDWRIWHNAFPAGRSISIGQVSCVDDYDIFPVLPSATSFTVGGSASVNAAGSMYIAYVFTDTDVFKSFHYIGTGSPDGPVIDLGGRPLSIPLIKNAGGATDYLNLDTVRDQYNAVDTVLWPNLVNIENAGYGQYQISVRSNGFKVTNGGSYLNAAGNTHIGLAVMRQPYKYSNAF